MGLTGYHLGHFRDPKEQGLGKPSLGADEYVVEHLGVDVHFKGNRIKWRKICIAGYEEKW